MGLSVTADTLYSSLPDSSSPAPSSSVYVTVQFTAPGKPAGEQGGVEGGALLGVAGAGGCSDGRCVEATSLTHLSIRALVHESHKRAVVLLAPINNSELPPVPSDGPDGRVQQGAAGGAAV